MNRTLHAHQKDELAELAVIAMRERGLEPEFNSAVRRQLDDIDGPGNNSYLFWDSATGMFTVVAWDHNLAFGASMGGAGPEAGPARQGANRVLDRGGKPAGR